MLNLFIEFLIQEGIYDAFVKNVIEQGEDGLLKYLEDNVGCGTIKFAFEWEDTPEKHDFWSDMDKYWRSLCEAYGGK